MGQQLFLKPFLTHFEIFRAVVAVGRRADNRTLGVASPPAITITRFYA